MAPAIGGSVCFDLVRWTVAASTAAFLAAANLNHLSILWPFLLQKSQVSSLDGGVAIPCTYRTVLVIQFMDLVRD
jgi:hypothetical protein